MLRTIPALVIEYGKVDQGTIWSLHSHFLVSLLQATKKKKKNLDTNLATKPLTYNFSYLQKMLGKWWHRPWISQPLSDLT